jgi:hypothetical protein
LLVLLLLPLLLRPTTETQICVCPAGDTPTHYESFAG